MLKNLLKNVVGRRESPLADAGAAAPCVLNVGGGNKQIALPPTFVGWNHLLLDIAPGPDVDVALDARRLATLDAAQFDAIYCSHNLEHYYRHDCETVLAGFMHVLRPEGFADIRVPDMSAVLRSAVERRLDIDDALYIADAGPISVHDVIYGWGAQIERSGVDFYAHKRGFTVKSLSAALERAGFARVFTAVLQEKFEIRALAFKAEPSDAQKAVFGL